MQSVPGASYLNNWIVGVLNTNSAVNVVSTYEFSVAFPPPTTLQLAMSMLQMGLIGAVSSECIV